MHQCASGAYHVAPLAQPLDFVLSAESAAACHFTRTEPGPVPEGGELWSPFDTLRTASGRPSAPRERRWPGGGPADGGPVIKWLLGYALLTVAVMVAGGAWVLLPEKRRLEQVQCAFNAQLPTHGGHSDIALPLQPEKAKAGPGSSRGGAGMWPPPSAAKAGAAPTSAGSKTQTAPAAGDNAGAWRCQRFAQDPVSLFMPPGHGPPAGLRWRVTPAGDEAGRRGWSVALTTDYAGLERLLSAICGAAGLSRSAGIIAESDTRRIDAGFQINARKRKGGR